MSTAMDAAVLRCEVCVQFRPQQHKELLMPTSTPTLLGVKSDQTYSNGMVRITWWWSFSGGAGFG